MYPAVCDCIIDSITMHKCTSVIQCTLYALNPSIPLYIPLYTLSYPLLPSKILYTFYTSLHSTIPTIPHYNCINIAIPTIYDFPHYT